MLSVSRMLSPVELFRMTHMHGLPHGLACMRTRRRALSRTEQPCIAHCGCASTLCRAGAGDLRGAGTGRGCLCRTACAVGADCVCRTVGVCRMVMNKATGKPKGTAFVQFSDGAAAQKACAACARQRDGSGEGMSLRGKVLGIDAALVQDSARALAQSKGGAKGGDRRNLHLVCSPVVCAAVLLPPGPDAAPMPSVLSRPLASCLGQAVAGAPHSGSYMRDLT